MTETDTSYTSILLPAAKVALFTNDTQTIDAFQALQSDWRFTRVLLNPYAGGVEEAIRVIAGGVAPDLVIIQTETIDDSFTARLEVLSNHCPEGTAAIVIGPVNDVNLYRKLISMGISDYLVRPIRAETLGFDIARSLIERIGASSSRLVALIGAKGGVGTTVLAQALGWGSADILKQKTILLDAAGGWSSMSVGLNFEPAATLVEAVRAVQAKSDEALERMIEKPDDRLHILSSGADSMLDKTVDATGYETLIDRLMQTYPMVVVDLSHAPSDLMRMVISRAHEIVLVTTPVLPALRAARSLIQEIKDIRSDSESRIDLVVNMAGMTPKLEVPKSDLEAALNRKPALQVNFNSALFGVAEAEGQRLGRIAGGDDIIRQMTRLVLKIVDRPGIDAAIDTPDESGKKKPLGGLLDKLGKKG